MERGERTGKIEVEAEERKFSWSSFLRECCGWEGRAAVQLLCGGGRGRERLTVLQFWLVLYPAADEWDGSSLLLGSNASAVEHRRLAGPEDDRRMGLL